MGWNTMLMSLVVIERTPAAGPAWLGSPVNVQFRRSCDMASARSRSTARGRAYLSLARSNKALGSWLLQECNACLEHPVLRNRLSVPSARVVGSATPPNLPLLRP